MRVCVLHLAVLISERSTHG